ncbi:MAG: NAD-dependent epimerase/dehydratase family protein [Chloroflexi bacterium]|nr:NAD-dependent epimerase/dehydratase family protein [Chloroflexota bacterium]
MAQQGKVVAVTGASGYVGTKLLARLEQESGLRKLVAFDVNPLPLPVHNIAFYRKNVSEPIEDELNDQGATTLVHLAFNARRGANRREVAAIHEENLETLRSVMASCASARVTHLIYLSSHTVYGAHSDNPVPISDDAPMRPSLDFPYAYDKHQCELLLEEFAQAQEEVKITVLRSCTVLGHGADTWATRSFFRPWLLGVLDYDPPMQFVYDDDLARVIAIMIQQEIPGTFNVAGDGVVHYREMAKIIKSKLINLPPFVAYPLVRLCWGLRLQREASSNGLDQVRWPIVMSTGKLHKATGYRFWHTALESLTAFANSAYLYKDPSPF